MKVKNLLLPWMLFASDSIHSVSSSSRTEEDTEEVGIEFFNLPTCSKTSCMVYKCCTGYKCEGSLFSKNCVKERSSPTPAPTPINPRCAKLMNQCSSMSCCAGLKCLKLLSASLCVSGSQPTPPPLLRTRVPKTTEAPTSSPTKLSEKPTPAPTSSPIKSSAEPTPAPTSSLTKSSEEPTPAPSSCADLLKECGGDSGNGCCPGLTCLPIARTRIGGQTKGNVCLQPVPTPIPTSEPTKKPTASCSKSLCTNKQKCCDGLKCSGLWGWGKCIDKKPTPSCSKKVCAGKMKCCDGLKCSGKWGWGTCIVKGSKPTPAPGSKPTSEPTKKPTASCSKSLCTNKQKCCDGLKCSGLWGWGTCKDKKPTPSCSKKVCAGKMKCCDGLKCSGKWGWGTCKEDAS